MKVAEDSLLRGLKRLKELGAFSIKAEFEAEGSRLQDVIRLADLVAKADMTLTIKIGGGEAIRDMRDAQMVGATRIVAPMIESAYALSKFVVAAKHVWAEDINTSFLINVETKLAYDQLMPVLSNKSPLIDGVVFGRVDFTGSLGVDRSSVDNDRLLQVAKDLDTACRTRLHKFFVGGAVSINSYNFLKAIPNLHGFETRKVVFSVDALENYPEAIKEALTFELRWLYNLRRSYRGIAEEENDRMSMIQKRLEALDSHINLKMT